MERTHVRLDQLVINPTINPRHASDDDVADLVAQIRVNGFTDALWVRISADGQSYEVIDGSRRLRALQILHDAGETVNTGGDGVPVDVFAATDSRAQELALAANVTRSDLSPADEAVAFYRLKLSGMDENAIASHFAVPLRRVQQRISMGSLPEVILAALRKGSIDVQTAAAFTLTDSAERQLEVFGDGRNLSSYGVRNDLTGEAVQGHACEARFVGEDDYQAAGGRLSRDLFGENTYFLDAPLLHQLFDTKLKELARRVKDEGWNFVKIVKDHEAHRFHDVPPKGKLSLSEAESARLEGLQQALKAAEDRCAAADRAYDALVDDHTIDTPAGGAVAQECDDADEACQVIADEIESLTVRPWTQKQKGVSGALIVVGYRDVEVWRGKTEKAPAAKTSRTAADDPEADADDDAPPLPGAPSVSAGWSDALVDGMLLVAQQATILAMARHKPALAARFGLAARVAEFIDQTHNSPFAIRLETRRGGGGPAFAAITELQKERFAEVDDFAGILAVLETMTPEQLVELDAVITAFTFGVTALGNSDAAFVVAQVDADMRAEGFTPVEAFLARLSRDQLAMIAIEIDPDKPVPKGKKADMVAAVQPLITDSGWMPPMLRTPSYSGPGSATWDAAGDDAPGVADGATSAQQDEAA